jgi:RNA polymerase sigma factor (sigma-70 family)
MTESNEPINPLPSWLEDLTNSNLLKQPILRYLQRLKLDNSYQFDEIKNEIFLLIKDLVDSKKLSGEIFEENWVFTKVNPDGTPESIRSLEAWLRTVIWNYLLELQRREKLSLKVILLDEYPDLKINRLDYAEKIEIREKLKKLSHEDCRILELRFFEGLPFQEIAVRLQSEGFPKYTEEALRKKKQRALEKLRLIY